MPRNPGETQIFYFTVPYGLFFKCCLFWWTDEKLNFFVTRYLNRMALRGWRSIRSPALQMESGCKILCMGEENLLLTWMPVWAEGEEIKASLGSAWHGCKGACLVSASLLKAVPGERSAHIFSISV